MTLPAVTIAAPAAGKWYSSAIRVETSGAGALSGLRMTSQLRTAGNSAIHATAVAHSIFSSDLATSISGDRTFWVRSKPFQAPAGVVCDQLQWAIDMYYSKTKGPLRVKLSRPMLREIADPRPGWGC